MARSACAEHRIPGYPLRAGTAAAVAYVGWICRRSGSGSIVVLQQSAETFSSFYSATLADGFRIRADQLIIEALMVAFTVVMHSEFGRCATNRAFAKQDQSLQQDSLIVRTNRSA